MQKEGTYSVPVKKVDEILFHQMISQPVLFQT